MPLFDKHDEHHVFSFIDTAFLQYEYLEKYHQQALIVAPALPGFSSLSQPIPFTL